MSWDRRYFNRCLVTRKWGFSLIVSAPAHQDGSVFLEKVGIDSPYDETDETPRHELPRRMWRTCDLWFLRKGKSVLRTRTGIRDPDLKVDRNGRILTYDENVNVPTQA